jgi:long-subunit fatty acid transport protein
VVLLGVQVVAQEVEVTVQQVADIEGNNFLNIFMKLFSLLYVIMQSLVGLSQNEDDALRYSQTFLGGTARNLSMGGAMSALGGDFGAVSQNPASMAQFNQNNFSFTPIFESAINKADFYGQTTKSTNSKLKIGNVSYLKSYDLTKIPNSNGWARLQLGVGLNRINTFENYKSYSGTVDGSIINSFINEANGTPDSLVFGSYRYSAGLAYEVYAIDPDINSTDNSYTSSYSGFSKHNRTINSEGGITEFSFVMSANYKNKLYLGGTINIERVKYYTNFSHKEDFVLKDSIWLNSITYSGFLDTEGKGVNAKIGAIYLVNENLRFGLSVHTPTFYKLKDLWGNDMTASTDDPNNPLKTIAVSIKPTGEYDYRLVTPLRMNLSSGIIINKKGAIGIEFEYVDYSLAVLKSIKNAKSPYSFSDENQQIKNIYSSKINFKLGGEYRLTPMLNLRGGYAIYASPYTQKSGVKVSPNQFITTGFGLNFGKAYFDFAVVYNTNNYNYYAYNPDFVGSKAYFIEDNLRFSATLGIRFK